MRLWSIHPRYLDAKGLVALWREALLAQAVLAGKTRGYRSHPQLDRFRAQANPSGCVAVYLREVADEAARRGYAFDRARIARTRTRGRIDVTRGQMVYEWKHLMAKLGRRSPEWRASLRGEEPEPHPLFVVVEGPIAPWERR